MSRCPNCHTPTTSHESVSGLCRGCNQPVARELTPLFENAEEMMFGRACRPMTTQESADTALYCDVTLRARAA